MQFIQNKLWKEFYFCCLLLKFHFRGVMPVDLHDRAWVMVSRSSWQMSHQIYVTRSGRTFVENRDAGWSILACAKFVQDCVTTKTANMAYSMERLNFSDKTKCFAWLWRCDCYCRSRIMDLFWENGGIDHHEGGSLWVAPWAGPFPRGQWACHSSQNSLLISQSQKRNGVQICHISEKAMVCNITRMVFWSVTSVEWCSGLLHQ